VPPQLLRTPVPTNEVFGLAGSGVLKLTSEATVMPEMIAPYARSWLTTVISNVPASIA
jgi:hypothetical protein